MDSLSAIFCTSLRPLHSCVESWRRRADRDDPATELASFKVANGFEVSLFASEKDGIVKPIQMRFDARGRLWVIGSQTYPQAKPGEEPNDKVWIVEDSNKDGRAEVTVFPDGLMIPMGLEIAPAPQVIPSERSGSRNLKLPPPSARAAVEERQNRSPSPPLGMTKGAPRRFPLPRSTLARARSSG